MVQYFMNFLDQIFTGFENTEVPEMDMGMLNRNQILLDTVYQAFQDVESGDDAWDAVEDCQGALMELRRVLRDSGAAPCNLSTYPSEIAIRLQEQKRLLEIGMQLPRTSGPSLKKMHPRYRQIASEVRLLVPILLAFNLFKLIKNPVLQYIEEAILEGLDNIVGLLLGVLPNEELDSRITVTPFDLVKMDTEWANFWLMIKELEADN